MLTRRSLILSAACLPFAHAARAATPEVFATHGIAIHGTDPVAYFRQSAQVDGDAGFALVWRGAEWRFSSAENRLAFEMDPLVYAPQYGGYCAYAMAQGAVAPTVPEAWTVHEGKLYLNFSTGVRDLWRQDIPGHVAAADDHWPRVIGG